MMQFVYRALYSLPILHDIQQRCNNYQKIKKYHKSNHRFMYKTNSSDHSLLTFNLPFKVILRLFAKDW